MIFEKFEEWEEQNKIESDALARKKQEIIDLMRNMPLQTLVIAYIYAKNYTEYGVDVTKTWLTVVENSEALKNAYNKGYYDGCKIVIDNLDIMNGN